MSDYADEELRAAQTALTDAEKMLRAEISPSFASDDRKPADGNDSH